jgi:sugar lactone lactonase YvrE
MVKTHPVLALTATKLRFVGENCRTLYISTARDGISGEQFETQPLSGNPFCMQSGARFGRSTV